MKEGGDKITWNVHPAKERPFACIIVTVSLILFCIIIYYYSESKFLTVISAIILVVSLQTFFLPTEYVLDNEGVEIRRLFNRQKRPWSVFRSFYGSNKGFQLSTFVEPTWLDSYRGIFLILRGNLAEVKEFLEKKELIETHGPKRAKK
jgi:hypothetical protein